MITCKRCEVDKPESEMLQRRGAPSKVCLECFGKAMAKGADRADRDAKKAARESGGGQPRKKGSPL